jgi:hypothetical protein
VNIEQRHKSMARPGIGIDWLANRLIEGAGRRPGMSLVPKAFFTRTGRYHPVPRICAIPRASFRLSRAALSATSDRSSASIP